MADAARPRLLRIAVVGAESTGKTTLCQALAQQLQPAAPTVAEYARSRWQALGSRGFGYADMLPIAQQQVRLEMQAAAKADAAQPAARWLLCDTTPISTLHYCLACFGKAPLPLWALSTRAYDAVLLCAPDIPFVQDGQRSSDIFRQRQHAWHVQTLAQRDIACTLLEGDLPARLRQAVVALAAVADSTAKLLQQPELVQ